MVFALYQVRWVGGEEKVKEQRKEKETVSWCLPYRGGQYGIYQVSLIQQEGRRSWPWHQSSHPSATCLFNTLLPRVMGRREGHGVAAPGPCLDAGRRRLVARPLPVWHPCDQSLHTRWHALGLGLFFPLLGLQPTYLALERLAASSQIGRTSQMGTESTVPTGGKKTCEPREIS